MIIARFSNGFTDTYKGKRAVKAAWMVQTPDGRTLSGHSNDRAAAEKTARATCHQACPHSEMKMVGIRNYPVTPAAAAHFNEVARKRGFADYKAFNRDAAAKRGPWIAACKIEIVDL